MHETIETIGVDYK